MHLITSALIIAATAVSVPEETAERHRWLAGLMPEEAESVLVWNIEALSEAMENKPLGGPGSERYLADALPFLEGGKGEVCALDLKSITPARNLPKVKSLVMGGANLGPAMFSGRGQGGPSGLLWRGLALRGSPGPFLDALAERAESDDRIAVRESGDVATLVEVRCEASKGGEPFSDYLAAIAPSVLVHGMNETGTRSIIDKSMGDPELPSELKPLAEGIDWSAPITVVRKMNYATLQMAPPGTSPPPEMETAVMERKFAGFAATFTVGDSAGLKVRAVGEDTAMATRFVQMFFDRYVYKLVKEEETEDGIELEFELQEEYLPAPEEGPPAMMIYSMMLFGWHDTL